MYIHKHRIPLKWYSVWMGESRRIDIESGQLCVASAKLHVFTHHEKPDSIQCIGIFIVGTLIGQSVSHSIGGLADRVRSIFIYTMKCMSYDIDTTKQPQQCRNFNADLRRMYMAHIHMCIVHTQYMSCIIFENS